MCLKSVEEIYPNPSKVITNGWKVFRYNARKPLEFDTMTYKKSQFVPLDRWITAEGDTPIIASDGNSYKPGFHVYYDEVELKKESIKTHRVFVRNITCKGTQDKRTVIIAEEMYVSSKPDGWPPLEGKSNDTPPTPLSPEDKKESKLARLGNKLFSKEGNA